LDAERFERLGVRQPSSGGLGQLAVGRQVVVAALGSDGLALQVARVVAAALPECWMRSSHSR
jgi:hypothetical protein